MTSSPPPFPSPHPLHPPPPPSSFLLRLTSLGALILHFLCCRWREFKWFAELRDGEGQRGGRVAGQARRRRGFEKEGPTVEPSELQQVAQAVGRHPSSLASTPEFSNFVISGSSSDEDFASDEKFDSRFDVRFGDELNDISLDELPVELSIGGEMI